tara:strand:+ start:8326 stop:8682 length:357 start_codon:yes stop_codon:yes gene_type:complete
MVTNVSFIKIIKKQRKIQLSKISCRGCYYEIKKQCYWFKEIENTSPKEIPNKVLEKGCKKYLNTNLKKVVSNLAKEFIKVFDGEILSDKYKIRKEYYKPYQKKTYKSPHNYTYRRDAQ